jgi:hypothetical protein
LSARDCTKLQQLPLSVNAGHSKVYKLTVMDCWNRLECCSLRVTLNPIQASI